MMLEVWESVELAQGEMGLNANRKLPKRMWESMKFSRAAQVMSATMVNMIDLVHEPPQTFPTKKLPPKFNQKPVFSKIRELARK
jgi:hypothetical protein